jgi:hypothetical protein
MRESCLKNQKISEECEYLTGDDACSAVKEAEASPLRAEACQNEIKDRCCYKCSLRETCEIRCDLLEHRNQERDEPLPTSPAPSADKCVDARCGECEFYLKSKCPRGYSSDQGLWRRQEGCEIFKPKQKTQSRP